METKINIISKLFYSCVGLILLIMNHAAYAVVIGPDTIINVPTTYSNTTVDLTNGNFIVREGATLTIENSTVFGTISPANPNLISVERGGLNLTNNNVSVSTSSVIPTPKTEASFFAIRLGRATATITGNTFTIDNQFSAGLLTSSVILPAKDITIVNNQFQNFHGVLYLLRSNNTIVDGNLFKMNSAGHIAIVGSNAKITNNSIYFSGLNQLGDAIDLVNAENVTIAKNLIFTPTSEGISMISSHNVLVDSNTVTGGITYGIRVFSVSELSKLDNTIARIVAKLGRRMKHQATMDLTVSNNYLGQNRYGFAAVDVNNLTVTGNFFTQKFEDAATRQFWTDNTNLLVNVTSLTWANNIYKEAFTQVNGGDNSNTEFVTFPATGGVVL